MKQGESLKPKGILRGTFSISPSSIEYTDLKRGKEKMGPETRPILSPLIQTNSWRTLFINSTIHKNPIKR